MADLTEQDFPGQEKGEDRALILANAGSNIHGGMALGFTGSPRKFVRPFVDGDDLAGLAMESKDSTAIVAGKEELLEVLQAGRVELAVAGVLDDRHIGSIVYLTNSGTYSLTDTGSDKVFGKVKKVPRSGWAVVKFAAVAV